MHAETLRLFKRAINDSLRHLQPYIGKYTEQHEIWHKESESKWCGRYEERVDIQKTLYAVEQEIKTFSIAFEESFVLHHSDHAGLVGLSGSQTNLGISPAYIVLNALFQLWSRHKTFELQSDEVELIAEEFSDFIERPSVKLKFQTQLINFKMSADALDLPAQLSIRRLSEEEVTQMHGGPISTLGFTRQRFSSIHEFVIEGFIDEPKILGNANSPGELMVTRAKILLDKATLCLRTFKQGPVGYDFIHFRPMTFCPVGQFSTGNSDFYVPFGSYSLVGDELEKFSDHAKLIFSASDASMIIACSRLADAEHRTQAQDRIIDAVIGMEAILLSCHEPKGEMSFRFSLNYAMLFPVDEREGAYNIAKDLYNLRSTIAHGSVITNSKLKIDGKKVDLPAAAKIATSALRTIITHFLAIKGSPYKNSEFWRRAYFGLPNTD